MPLYLSEDMTLHTPDELTLIAGRLGLTGEALAAAFEKIDLFSAEMKANLMDVKLFSKRLRSRVENAVQAFVSRYVKVDGVDSVVIKEGEA